MRFKLNSRGGLAFSILLLVLFGASIGCVGTIFYLNNYIHGQLEAGQAGTRRLIMWKLEKDLQLTPEQSAKMNPIIEGAQKEFAQLRAAHINEINAILSHIREANQSILDKKQQSDLALILERFVKRITQGAERTSPS